MLVNRFKDVRNVVGSRKWSLGMTQQGKIANLPTTPPFRQSRLQSSADCGCITCAWWSGQDCRDDNIAF